MVIALGGNALLRRGEPMSVESQRHNVRTACEAIAPLASHHEVVVTHGNGPQIGLLALQTEAYDPRSRYPLDVLGAQTEGMIGYWIEQELGNLLPPDKPLATVLSMTEVDPEDPAFQHPTKFVGPVYTEREAHEIAEREGWTVRQDGSGWRRVVPSPRPLRVFQTRPVRWLLEHGALVICAGGGGIPTVFRPGSPDLVGVEAVVDKDRVAAVLAEEIGADLLIIATDAAGVYLDWGTEHTRLIAAANPADLSGYRFPDGSMGPKVEAAADFAVRTGHDAIIGALSDLGAITAGTSGTLISTRVTGTRFHPNGTPVHLESVPRPNPTESATPPTPTEPAPLPTPTEPAPLPIPGGHPLP